MIVALPGLFSYLVFHLRFFGLLLDSVMYCLLLLYSECIGPTAFFASLLTAYNSRYEYCILSEISLLPLQLQSNLVISNSLISNYRLSRSENLVPVLT